MILWVFTRQYNSPWNFHQPQVTDCLQSGEVTTHIHTGFLIRHHLLTFSSVALDLPLSPPSHSFLLIASLFYSPTEKRGTCCAALSMRQCSRMRWNGPWVGMAWERDRNRTYIRMCVCTYVQTHPRSVEEQVHLHSHVHVHAQRLDVRTCTYVDRPPITYGHGA